MKLLFDLFPVVLFFVAFKLSDIFIATAVAMAATALQIAWVWFRYRKVETMLWVSMVIIAVFGGATLLFHDENFIKWKPTILYWLFAATLLGSRLLLRKNLIRSLMSEQMQLPDPTWERLNLAWAGFFALMGILNLFVAFNFPTDTWVNFKLFGGMGLMLLFVLAQGVFLAKYIEEEKS